MRGEQSEKILLCTSCFIEGSMMLLLIGRQNYKKNGKRVFVRAVEAGETTLRKWTQTGKASKGGTNTISIFGARSTYGWQATTERNGVNRFEDIRDFRAVALHSMLVYDNTPARKSRAIDTTTRLRWVQGRLVPKLPVYLVFWERVDFGAQTRIRPPGGMLKLGKTCLQGCWIHKPNFSLFSKRRPHHPS